MTPPTQPPTYATDSGPEPIQKPLWIRAKAPVGTAYEEIASIMRSQSLHTVCEEASCPNRGECWNKRHATFMIMGRICTRACAFCNVQTGKPLPLDPNEAENIANAVCQMKLNHVVITSVDRDDLPDGGAGAFVNLIQTLRKRARGCTIEILTPDFKNKSGAAESVISAHPDIFSHNIETVPRLYPSIKRGARYTTSLELLGKIKIADPSIWTKSSLMLGLGEEREEVLCVMDDLRAAHVDFLTIGQYLQPTPKHATVASYVDPSEFESYADIARAKGFRLVSSSPLTRSSFHAEEDFNKLIHAG